MTVCFHVWAWVFTERTCHFPEIFLRNFRKTDVERYYLPDGRKLETDHVNLLKNHNKNFFQKFLWNTKRSWTKQYCFVQLLFCVYVIRPMDGLWFLSKNMGICFSNTLPVRLFFRRLFLKFYKKISIGNLPLFFSVKTKGEFWNKQSNKHPVAGFFINTQKDAFSTPGWILFKRSGRAL